MSGPNTEDAENSDRAPPTHAPSGSSVLEPSSSTLDRFPHGSPPTGREFCDVGLPHRAHAVESTHLRPRYNPKSTKAALRILPHLDSRAADRAVMGRRRRPLDRVRGLRRRRPSDTAPILRARSAATGATLMTPTPTRRRTDDDRRGGDGSNPGPGHPGAPPGHRLLDTVGWRARNAAARQLRRRAGWLTRSWRADTSTPQTTLPGGRTASRA